ncbi:MAG: precorrin-4 C(11)-methyltransferase [Prevotella sp.]|nr:precorrin-4 C(11)-methyltransferase [Prevotella sp.]
MQKKIAIIPIGEAATTLVATLCRELSAEVISRNDVASRWHDYEAFVFIGAMGICVRTIAPLIEDKHRDPAVVCIDSLGQHAISVLSGHVGGANELTRRIASIVDAQPVITTQSDLSGLWSLDTLHHRFGWHLYDEGHLNQCIAAFVNRQPTALLLKTHDAGTDYLLRTLPEHVTLVSDASEVDAHYKLLIAVSPYNEPAAILTLRYVPPVVTVGFGLAHQAQPVARIYDEMCQAMTDAGLLPCPRRWCTVDVKANEPFVDYLRQRGQTVDFFTAEELAQVSVPHPSTTVAKHVGTPSVSEAAAILGSCGGQLIVEKVKGSNWTLAVARPMAHIEIVGAGPGDPDLISVRGRRFLEQADLILYAGSLVPKALTDCHKPGAVVRSSADMALEEQCQLMKEHYDQGHLIVRLHTGDPCIFGAIQEQMAFFDREGMHYHITPGISSFLAAAAELRSQFTIPERTQTIILTRGEGRTPMPEREKLHLLARSQSTMCIFLSAAIVDKVQAELLQEYPEDTPVAACYHLTWPDQHIYRGVLKDLAKIVHDNHLTLTTMLVVGEAIDNRHGLSELYNRHFTHLYRKGEAE